MSEPLTLHTPAKINLALSVGPPSVDGMHPISSWMVTVNLHDELTVTRLPADRLSRYAILWHDDALRRTEIDWSITRDLAVRAHLALEEHVGRRLPVQLKLEKRIPVAAGLGGGSADAAAMLRAVNRLYELDLSPETLESIAATLGSDVAFFVRGGSAIVEGLGERVAKRKTLPELHAVVVMPEAECGTGEVYRAFDAMGEQPELRSEAVRSLCEQFEAGGIDAEAPFNDLAEAAASISPGLPDVREAVIELAERPAHVTGSGSGIFVLCDDPMHAEALAAAITDRLGHAAAAVQSCRTPISPVEHVGE